MDYVIITNGELYHYGVKGQKWGVRRYQNPDGSLTTKGKKRIGKEYDKASQKTMTNLTRQYNSMYIKSYNKAADEMNNGGIARFNAEQRKQYGDEYAKRDGYVSDYNKMFAKQVAKHMDRSLDNFYRNDKNFKKCESLVNKYNMTEWHDLAKKNSAVIADLRRVIETGDHGD